MAIKKDPIASIRNHTNELKVHEKTVRIVIKKELSQDLNSLGYTGHFRKQIKSNFPYKDWFA